MIPFPSVVWKIGAALALIGALAAAHTWRVHQADQEGFDRATSERAARDLAAVVNRVGENTAIGIKQDSLNKFLTKDKDEKLAPVVQRIYVDRVRVGPAICGGPATPAQTESAGGSDGTDTGGRLVRSDIERDLRALKVAVEQHFATGRTCQAFVTGNGLAP